MPRRSPQRHTPQLPAHAFLVQIRLTQHLLPPIEPRTRPLPNHHPTPHALLSNLKDPIPARDIKRMGRRIRLLLLEPRAIRIDRPGPMRAEQGTQATAIRRVVPHHRKRTRKRSFARPGRRRRVHGAVIEIDAAFAQDAPFRGRDEELAARARDGEVERVQLAAEVADQRADVGDVVEDFAESEAWALWFAGGFVGMVACVAGVAVPPGFGGGGSVQGEGVEDRERAAEYFAEDVEWDVDVFEFERTEVAGECGVAEEETGERRFGKFWDVS